jgi:replicative DNA helicase
LISADSFYVAAHQKIYAACSALYKKSTPIDLLTVCDYLASTGELDAIGGSSTVVYLVEYSRGVCAELLLSAYCQKIQEYFIRRKLIEVSGRLRELAVKSDLPLADVANQAQEMLLSTTALAFPQAGNSASLGKLASDALIEMVKVDEARQRGEVLKQKYATGFYDFDQLTGGGLDPGDLIILAGRPSMGKTSMGIQLAVNIAELNNTPVAIFSLEMSKESLTYRIMSGRSKTRSSEYGATANDLRSANLPDAMWSKMAQVVNDLQPLPIAIEDRSSCTVEKIRHSAGKIKAKYGGNLGVILIDYLQLMSVEGESSNGSGNRNAEISAISRKLKVMAMELGVVVIALSQLNRSVESRADKRPALSDLRDSGSLEQDGDQVLFLYRDEYYNPDTADRGVAELIVAKHRNGPTGTVQLLFDPRLTKFENLAASK